MLLGTFDQHGRRLNSPFVFVGTVPKSYLTHDKGNTQMTDNHNAQQAALDIQEELTELVNPDAPVEAQYDLDEDVQRHILGAMLDNTDFMRQGTTLVKPTYFHNIAHQNICQAAFEHFQRFEHLPHKFYLRERLTELATTDARRVLFIGELDSVLEHYVPGVHETEYLLDKISVFARSEAVRMAYANTAEQIQRGRVNWEKAQAEVQEAYRVGDGLRSNIEPKRFTDLLALYDEQFSWVVENWLPKGTTKLVAGRGKGGKTTYLFGNMMDIVFEDRVMGERATPCPVIVLDYDNPLYHPTKIMKDCIGDRDVETWNQHLDFYSRYFKDEAGSLPPYLTLDFMDKITARAEDQYGSKGIVVVDTFASAFARMPNLPPNFENDNSTISQILGPVVEFSHTSQWTIILVHHESKAGDVRGATAFVNTVDTIDVFDRPTASQEATVTTIGRMPPVKPRRLLYENSRYRFVGVAGDARTDRQRELLAMQKVLTYVDRVPATERLSKDTIYRNADTGLSRDRCRQLVDTLREKGILNRDYRKVDDWQTRFDGLVVEYGDENQV